MYDVFIALYCVLLIVYCCSPKVLYIHFWAEVGFTLLNHQQCVASTWIMRRLPQDNGASALTTHQLQVERRKRVIEPIKCVRSPHTSYRWRGERESLSQSSGWGLLGAQDWQGPVMGIWPGHRDYTPTLYEKCHGIFKDPKRVRTSV